MNLLPLREQQALLVQRVLLVQMEKMERQVQQAQQAQPVLPEQGWKESWTLILWRLPVIRLGRWFSTMVPAMWL